MVRDIFIILSNLKLELKTLKTQMEQKLADKNFKEFEETFEKIEFLASEGQKWSTEILSDLINNWFLKSIKLLLLFINL